NTQAIPDRLNTVIENVYCYENRNFVAVTHEKNEATKVFAARALDSVLTRCFDREKLSVVCNDSISLRERCFHEFLRKRDNTFFSNMSMEGVNIRNFSDYMSMFKVMVKREAKVKLDSSSLSKYPPAQNIIYHSKLVNSIFSPIFSELQRRLIASLNDNIIVYTGMAPNVFARKLTRLVGNGQDMHVGEIDFSKYDKSQDEYIKAFELEFYSLFGITAEMLDLWSAAEYFCNARVTGGALSFKLQTQRRSGGANTFLGNTIVNLMILSLYYNLPLVDAVCVAGDDSVMYSREDIVNHAQRMVNDIGMEAKFIKNSYGYFCSRFLVPAGDRIYFVPDPYKFMVKLFKPTPIYNDVELRERYISYKDNCTAFGNEGVVSRLVDLVNDRYKIEGKHTYSAIASVHCILANYSRFRSMYPISWSFINVWHLAGAKLMDKLGFEKIHENESKDVFVYSKHYGWLHHKTDEELKCMSDLSESRYAKVTRKAEKYLNPRFKKHIVKLLRKMELKGGFRLTDEG
ncbi:RNA-dependent RNA polymerase, partial [Persimmon virus B]